MSTMSQWASEQRRRENAAADFADTMRAGRADRDAERRAVEHVGATVCRRWTQTNRHGTVTAVGTFGSVTVEWCDGTVESVSPSALRALDES